ncbi:Pao retrotransposon peptidase family protein [Aphelenchoides avenae]|nr:Pao retrotransposon peptidase family protein [Aphelenchus avenae]
MASVSSTSARASVHVAKDLQLEVAKVYNFTSVIATFYRESGRTPEVTKISNVLDSDYTAELQQENLFQQLHSLEQKRAEPPNAPTEDDAAHQRIHDSIHWVDGRYEADLPRQTTDGKAPFNADLSDNFAYAFDFLQTLIKTLSKSPELLADYDKAFKKCLASGIISEVARESKYTTHYHSHQAVVKARPVNNGIPRTVKTSFSLNDWLNKGTLLLNLLTAVRLNSRLALYVLPPSTAKVSLQISMREEDPQVCLFLWVRAANEPASGEKLVIYCIGHRVISGVRSSPRYFVSPSSTIWKKLTPHFPANIYLTADDIEEASDKYRTSKFDPLGFVSPEILPARLAVQATCKAKYGWDDPTDTKLLEQWNGAIECWASIEM